MSKWNVVDYHRNSTNQQRWAQDLIASLNLKGNERILDIGCGDGKITAEISRLVPNGSVLGIDISDEMLRFAQCNFTNSKYPNLSFEYGDAGNLRFDREFDVIVSFACLHWVPNHLPVLDGVKNSLKNQGKLFLQLGGKGNARPIQIATQEVMKRERWCHYFDDFIYKTRFYSDYEYWNLLKKVGLTAQRIELIPKQMIHENREQLIGWLRVVGTPNYVGVLPEELQQLIIAEIVDTYLHCHPPDDEGIIRTPMVRLEVEATKLPSQWNQFY